MVQRRHVFYVEGYDPQGARGYYGIFQYAAKRFRDIWPVALDVGPLQLDTDLVAHWDIRASAANWHTLTRYEFLRLEGVIKANMAQSLWLQIPRALRWAATDVTSGTTARLVKASPRFAVHLIYFQVMMLMWLSLSAAAGVLAELAARRLTGLPVALSVATGIVAAVAALMLLRPLAQRWFVIQINNCWPHLREFAHGAPSAFDVPIDVFAERIVAAARADEADEIVIVGHSGGCVIAPVVLARALEFDPDLGRRGPQVILLTLGSIMPAAGLHPAAHRLHSVVRRIAVEPSVHWIDCQSHTDWLNFSDFDPVEGIGIRLDAPRRNPAIWPVRFRDMLAAATIKSMRWNLFRMHYQFIMGNDRQAPFDYVMLCCGPVPVNDWRSGHWAAVEGLAGGAEQSPMRSQDAVSIAPSLPDGAGIASRA